MFNIMNDEINIKHLTPYQVEMLDHMWSLDTEQEYLDWYNLLDQKDQTQADLLMRLLVIEVLEREADRHQDPYAQANAVLQKFRLN